MIFLNMKNLFNGILWYGGKGLAEAYGEKGLAGNRWQEHMTGRGWRETGGGKELAGKY